jgi:hypothetical protein
MSGEKCLEYYCVDEKQYNKLSLHLEMRNFDHQNRSKLQVFTRLRSKTRLNFDEAPLDLQIDPHNYDLFPSLYPQF